MNFRLIVIVVSLYRCRSIRLRCQPVKLPRMRCDSENNHNNHYQGMKGAVVVGSGGGDGGTGGNGGDNSTGRLN